MEITWVTYEIAILAILTPINIFFLILLKNNFETKKNSITGHLTIMLVLFWLYFLSKLSPSAWECIEFMGCKLPPLHVIMEIIATGYLLAIVWHLWWNDKDVEMFGRSE